MMRPMDRQLARVKNLSPTRCRAQFSMNIASAKLERTIGPRALAGGADTFDAAGLGAIGGQPEAAKLSDARASEQNVMLAAPCDRASRYHDREGAQDPSCES